MCGISKVNSLTSRHLLPRKWVLPGDCLLHQLVLVALMCQQRAEQAQCPNTESETGVTSCWLHDRRRFAGELNLPACLQKGKNPFK